LTLRKIIPILIVYSCLSRSALAQEDPSYSSSLLASSAVYNRDFRMTVLPITGVTFIGLGLKVGLGTGFCLDQGCRFIGTDYHTAFLAHPRKIKGQKVVQLYLATGPKDEGATVNVGYSTGPMKYTLRRDLAIFELHHSLPYHHGLAFSLDDLEVGQEIDIYTYPLEGLNPIRRLLQFHGQFKGQTTTGLLAFDYSLSANKAIRPGASGGIVVDSKTQQIVGILNAIASDGQAIAMAVPVQSLVDFVSEVQPNLIQSIFPSTKYISPASVDFYPKLVPPPPADVLQHRSEEPAEIKVLRSKAQLLADGMRDFIAVQTLAWGSGNKAPAASSSYEVRVRDGYQRFRKYPDGKKELADVPLPFLNNAISPGAEWSELPEMVGTKLRLKIEQPASVVVNGRRIKVFQYRADPEDALCTFRSILDFEFFAVSKIVSVGCYGEVWTDENTNIVRMSEHFEISGRWKDYQAVVTYGWLRRTDEAPKLVPLTISTQANLNKSVYWCRGEFTDYQVVGSRVKILAGKLHP
jgi:hypothetical protein